MILTAHVAAGFSAASVFVALASSRRFSMAERDAVVL
jgi:hypothetical protein